MSNSNKVEELVTKTCTELYFDINEIQRQLVNEIRSIRITDFFIIPENKDSNHAQKTQFATEIDKDQLDILSMEMNIKAYKEAQREKYELEELRRLYPEDHIWKNYSKSNTTQ